MLPAESTVAPDWSNMSPPPLARLFVLLPPANVLPMTVRAPWVSMAPPSPPFVTLSQKVEPTNVAVPKLAIAPAAPQPQPPAASLPEKVEPMTLRVLPVWLEIAPPQELLDSVLPEKVELTTVA
jgi:hypothetical protein